MQMSSYQIVIFVFSSTFMLKLLNPVNKKAWKTLFVTANDVFL